MAKRLTAKAIRYAMGQLKKGTSSSVVASEIGVTPRHVRRLWAEFRATGFPHVPKTPGRPTTKPSPDEVQLVLDEHKHEDVGVLRVAMNLRKSHDIRYSEVYRIMKESGLVTPSAAKSGRRKWIRYERKHSNSMWHTDWHVMKDPCFRGLHLITSPIEEPRKQYTTDFANTEGTGDSLSDLRTVVEQIIDMADMPKATVVTHVCHEYIYPDCGAVTTCVEPKKGNNIGRIPLDQPLL